MGDFFRERAKREEILINGTAQSPAGMPGEGERRLVALGREKADILTLKYQHANKLPVWRLNAGDEHLLHTAVVKVIGEVAFFLGF